MTTQNDGRNDSADPSVHPAATVEPTPSTSSGQALRQRAEGKARPIGHQDLEALSPEEARRLVSELHVYQIELEMQNEELRRTQRELELVRDQYLDLYDFAPVGYLTLSEAGLIPLANLTAATMLGVDRASLIGQPLSGFILSEDQDIYYLHRRKLLGTQRPQVCVLRMVRKDGSQFWARIDSAMALDDEGQAVCRTTVSDITEQKRAEQALLDREEKLHALFEILPVGISVLDNSHSIQLTNPALAQILRISRDQLLRGEYEARTYLRPDGTEMSPAEFPSMEAFREQRPIRNVEIGVLTEDGERIWTNVSAVPLPFADWRVILTVADITRQKQAEVELRRARDELELRVQKRTAELIGANEALRAEIAERRQVEERLRASEERFVQLAEQMDQGFWMLEPDSRRLQYASRAFGEIWGHSLKDLYRQPELFLESVVPEDRERVAAAFEASPTSQEAFDLQFRIVRPDGALRWLESRAFPIPDAEGNVRRLGGVIEDVTEQLQVEATLIQAERLGIAGKLAASLTHEINNPLQSAIGCLELAEEMLTGNEEALAFLRVSSEALERAASVVVQLRSLHSLPQSEEKRPTDLNSLMDKVWLLVGKRCRDWNIQVTLEAGENLPLLRLMPDAIQQMLLNLALNAVDAMPDGGILRLSTAATNQPVGVNIEFADSGIGIQPEEMDRIFEPFYSTKAQGLGLGLFISHSTVQQHGGQISVQSRVGEGTTFQVWLPA